jgi:hypothetical protein
MSTTSSTFDTIVGRVSVSFLIGLFTQDHLAAVGSRSSPALSELWVLNSSE